MSSDDTSATRQPNADDLSLETIDELGGARLAPSEGPETGRLLGRFRLGALLGHGGMGRVYEASDPRLHRVVAVKVLRGDSPVAVRRFVREARSQARVTHPGVCPIYEAGEVDGAPYIVMQRLFAEPLDLVASDRPLEEKLVLMRQVADAVHAAHRTGLIHRDLKPSNILVEAPEEGPLRPYVVDFGLARSTTSSDAFTRAGDIVGTPAYMAPEQVLGDHDQVDRRADVYSLGVTLYRLLAGDVPFGGLGGNALMRVISDDPASLRQQGVPADVEAIVFRCLEKDPDLRYGSARELAADLDRFLDGKPIRARPTDGWYRLQKWASRHRAAVVVGAISAMLLLVALGWGVWTSWRADERERWARDFTERVEEIEAMVRYSHLAPLHDTRPDRVLLRHRMAGIRNAMERAGPTGRGPGHYALGRGHLALDELEAARRHLSRAWDGGYREPAVAASLGSTLSALYREHLADIELEGDWPARQRRIDLLRETYGHPARTFLEQRRLLGPRPAPAGDADELLLQALAHFHDDRFADALRTLDDANGRTAWSYELARLEGDILHTWATELAAGGDTDEARARLRHAEVAYGRAAAIAESDPDGHRAAAQATFLHFAVQTTADDAESIYERGLASLDRARIAQPDDPRTDLWIARFHRRMAQTLRDRSTDPTDHLAAAITAAERAIEGLATPSAGWAELGRAQWSWAQWLRDRGEDPSSRLTLATAAFDRVATEHRDFGFWTALGLVHSTLAGHRASQGQPAAELYRRAADAYRAAAELHSAPFAAWTNLGVALFKLSVLPETESMNANLQEAIDALETAHTLDPNHVAPLYYLGLTRLRLGVDEDPVYGVIDANVAERALEHYARALAIAPNRFELHSAVGEVHHMRGVALDEVGDDPSDAFALAEQAHARALELAPRHPVPTVNLAWTLYHRALARFRDRQDPGRSLRRSLELATRALDSGRAGAALSCLGAGQLLEAEWRLHTGLDPSAALRRARETLAEANSRNARLPNARRLAAQVEILQAMWWSRRGHDPEPAFEAARRHLEPAIEMAPTSAPPQLARARFAVARTRWLRRQGRHDEATAEVVAGLDALRRARSARPGHLEIEPLETALTAAARQ